MYSILIFEDDRERIKWFKREFVGHEIQITQSVQGAIELLCNQDFDLILLDNDIVLEHYENPDCYDGTGRELADWLAQTKLNNSPVILIHSCNSVASQYMYDVLVTMYTTVKKSFAELQQKGIECAIKL
ncbi:MAG TPA: hypothetical protein PLP33_14840 [Leptospiraceae bacterium]|nr:hypothetical protein [Leptospiraceae bacterium]